MDTLTGLMMSMGPLVVAVLVVTEAIGRSFHWSKDRVAIVLGPTSCLIAEAIGWLNVGDGWRGYLGSAFVGLLATVGAQTTKDKLVRPVVDPLPPANVEP